MKVKSIFLREDDLSVKMTAYIAEENRCVFNAMLIIPGGGYGRVCADREGEPIAFAYLSRGFNTFVLEYSVGEKAKFPQPLIDASLAVKYIKTHSGKLNINPERVFVCGFSAGGHLAAMLGTMWNHKSVYEYTNIKYGENRPCGMILCYPVITGKKDECHEGSFCNLLGTESPTKEQMDYFSLENRVSEETVPVFMMHTAKDQTVPALSSIHFAEALARSGINYEMHIYPIGRHGSALATEVTALDNPEHILPRVSRWIDDSCAWIKETF